MVKKRGVFVAIVLSCAIVFISWKIAAPGAPWFETGWQLEYEYFDGSRQLAGKAHVTVTEVYTRHDTTFSVSDVNYTDENGTATGAGKLYFAKDSLSLIAELSNLVALKIRYDNIEEARISGNGHVYPLYPDTVTPLNNARGFITFVREGPNTGMIYETVNRRIAGTDTVLTAMGKIPCTLVLFEEHIRPLNVHKDQRELRVRRVKEWYHPRYGIVKAEYTRDGNVELVKVLTAVKQ